MAEHRHSSEGVIVILDALDSRNQRPWMKSMYRFSVVGHVLMVRADTGLGRTIRRGSGHTHGRAAS